MEPVEFEWVPAQDITKQGPDFRSLETSVRGFKIGHSSTANTTKTQPAVKAIAKAELRQTDADDMMEACDVEGSIAAPGTVQPRDVQGIGTKSSRSWKLASTARTSASVKKSKSSWDQKVRPMHRHGCRLMRWRPLRLDVNTGDVSDEAKERT